MPPIPQGPPTQQELDALERFGKFVGTLAIIGGALATLVRWLARRRLKREEQRAAHIERVVRAAFSKELSDMGSACESMTRIERQVGRNTDAIDRLVDAVERQFRGGDDFAGLVIGAMRENSEWLDDLQSLVDHSFKIDRRASVGQDRRQRVADRFDVLEEQRLQRRRAVDRLRDSVGESNTERGEVE